MGSVCIANSFGVNSQQWVEEMHFIRHVEGNLDGSAPYGSEAVASVVNLIDQSHLAFEVFWKRHGLQEPSSNAGTRKKTR